MKERDYEDLDRISSELAFNIKNFVRSYELKNLLVGGNQIKKDAEMMYIELREGYELDFEECEIVDRMFAKKMIFDIDKRKLRREAKRMMFYNSKKDDKLTSTEREEDTMKE